MLLLTTLLLGCTANPAASDKDTTSGIDDSGLADTGDTTGDTDPDAVPADITAEISDYVSTVVIVRWRTAVPTSGVVEFGTTEAYGHVTPATAEATEHEALLLGMTADTEVHFRVVNDAAGGSVASDDYTITTESLPSGLFPTRATGTAESWSGGFQVIPLQGTTFAVVIVDAQGQYVWYHFVEEVGNLMRAFMTDDGQYVVYCLAGPQDSLETGKVVKVSLDGGSVVETPFPYIDHDMTGLPDGSIAAIVVEDREGRSADKIVELAPDGTLTEIFNAWDHWDPDAIGIPEFEHNWTHGNALDYDPVEDVYYFSMKSVGSLAKIDRATGEVLWTMNGKLNQFDFGGAESILMHHQFEVLGDRLLFFENGPVERSASRAVEIEFDEVALTAHEVWSYTSDPPLYVFAKGDVHRFDDGNTQVVWSSAGQIQNVTPEGEVAWQLDLDLGQAITFVQVIDSMYGAR
ncbi:MAG: aryl-sulfate sulfotransferase [Pseudomonadota bacterium]|nr:aryl-sulfate sulfotransferase [Pseudomonadota bacterium]